MVKLGFATKESTKQVFIWVAKLFVWICYNREHKAHSFLTTWVGYTLEPKTDEDVVQVGYTLEPKMRTPIRF